MSLSFLFWFLWLLGLLFSGWGWVGVGPTGRTFPAVSGGVLLWAILFIAGMKLFGFPIHGG